MGGTFLTYHTGYFFLLKPKYEEVAQLSGKGQTGREEEYSDRRKHLDELENLVAVFQGVKPSEIEKIKVAFNNASGKKIMLPRENLDVPVALTSWGYLLKLETVDEAKITEFIVTNNDRAPEKAPI